MSSQASPSSIQEGLTAPESITVKRFENDGKDEECLRTPDIVLPVPPVLVIHITDIMKFDRDTFESKKVKVSENL